MNLLQPLKLLLPAILPSWNFFDVIAPSPRIQFALLNSKYEITTDWREFRPRPEQLSFMAMLKRMLWNQKWNESLFLVSCAERIAEKYTSHSENEILNRIEADLDSDAATHLQFRLLFIQRQGEDLKEEILFTSRLHELVKSESI